MGGRGTERVTPCGQGLLVVAVLRVSRLIVHVCRVGEGDEAVRVLDPLLLVLLVHGRGEVLLIRGELVIGLDLGVRALLSAFGGDI